MPHKTAKKRAAVSIPQRHHLDKRAGTIINEASAIAASDELLTTRQLADWLQCSEMWLEIGRHRGYGPRYQKLGARMVRYLRRDVIAWLDERRRQCTSEYTAA